MKKLVKWGIRLTALGALIMLICGIFLGPRVGTLTTFGYANNPYADVNATYRTEETVRTLNVDVSIGDIRFIPGNSFAIRTHGLKESGPDMEHGKLTEFGVYEGEATFRTVNEGPTIGYSDGDIVIEITVPASVRSIRASVDLGSLSLTGLCPETADLSVDLGSLQYDGDVKKTLTASTDMGDLSLNLDSEDPSLDLSVEMGDLTLNGRGLKEDLPSSGYSQTGTGPSITATTDLGSLTVNTAG